MLLLLLLLVLWLIIWSPAPSVWRPTAETTLSLMDDDDNVECCCCCCCEECDEAEEEEGERWRTSRSNCSAVNIRRPPDLATMDSCVDDVNDADDDDVIDLAAPLVNKEDDEGRSTSSGVWRCRRDTIITVLTLFFAFAWLLVTWGVKAMAANDDTETLITPHWRRAAMTTTTAAAAIMTDNNWDGMGWMGTYGFPGLSSGKMLTSHVDSPEFFSLLASPCICYLRLYPGGEMSSPKRVLYPSFSKTSQTSKYCLGAWRMVSSLKMEQRNKLYKSNH